MSQYGGVLETFCVLIGVMVTQIYTCVEIHRTIHGKKKKISLYYNIKNPFYIKILVDSYYLL